MMRRTGLVSRRGVVVVLAVALAAAVCFGGIRLVRLLQHRAAAQAAASVRASATAAVCAAAYRLALARPRAKVRTRPH